MTLNPGSVEPAAVCPRGGGDGQQAEGSGPRLKALTSQIHSLPTDWNDLEGVAVANRKRAGAFRRVVTLQEAGEPVGPLR